MARAKANKLYRTFVKGLITEAGFLTYPEDASVDELNTVIHRKGNRSRRLGLDYELNATPAFMAGRHNQQTTTEYYWKAAADVATVNFLCVQVHEIIYFFDASSAPLSDGLKAFKVDLTSYRAPNATMLQLRSNNVQMVSGKGYLFVVQEYIEPLVIEYDPEDDSITVNKVIIQMRDFDGVNDGLAIDEEPRNLSKEHHYNLLNQGWVTPGTKTPGTLPGGGTLSPPSYIDPYTGNTIPYNPDGSFPEEV
jgi:hypothetical protein